MRWILFRGTVNLFASIPPWKGFCCDSMLCREIELNWDWIGKADVFLISERVRGWEERVGGLLIVPACLTGVVWSVPAAHLQFPLNSITLGCFKFNYPFFFLTNLLPFYTYNNSFFGFSRRGEKQWGFQTKGCFRWTDECLMSVFFMHILEKLRVLCEAWAVWE